RGAFGAEGERTAVGEAGAGIGAVLALEQGDGLAAGGLELDAVELGAPLGDASALGAVAGVVGRAVVGEVDGAGRVGTDGQLVGAGGRGGLGGNRRQNEGGGGDQEGAEAGHVNTSFNVSYLEQYGQQDDLPRPRCAKFSRRLPERQKSCRFFNPLQKRVQRISPYAGLETVFGLPMGWRIAAPQHKRFSPASVVDR